MIQLEREKINDEMNWGKNNTNSRQLTEVRARVDHLRGLEKACDREEITNILADAFAKFDENKDGKVSKVSYFLQAQCVFRIPECLGIQFSVVLAKSSRGRG